MSYSHKNPIIISAILCIEALSYSFLLLLFLFFLPLILFVAAMIYFPFNEDKRGWVKLVQFILFIICAIAALGVGIFFHISFFVITNILSLFIYPENLAILCCLAIFSFFVYKTLFYSQFLYQIQLKQLQAGKVDFSYEKIPVREEFCYIITQGEQNQVCVYTFNKDKMKRIYLAAMYEGQVAKLEQHFSCHQPVIKGVASFQYVSFTINNEYYLWKNNTLQVKANKEFIQIKQKLFSIEEIEKIVVHISKSSIVRKLIIVFKNNRKIAIVCKHQFGPVFDVFYDEIEFIGDSYWIFDIGRLFAEASGIALEEQDLGRSIN